MCYRSRQLPDKQEVAVVILGRKIQDAHRPDGLTLFLGDAVVDHGPDGPTSHFFLLAHSPTANAGLPRLQRWQAPLHDVHKTECHCSAPGWNLEEGSSGVKCSE